MSDQYYSGTLLEKILMTHIQPTQLAYIMCTHIMTFIHWQHLLYTCTCMVSLSNVCVWDILTEAIDACVHPFNTHRSLQTLRPIGSSDI